MQIYSFYKYVVTTHVYYKNSVSGFKIILEIAIILIA